MAYLQPWTTKKDVDSAVTSTSHSLMCSSHSFAQRSDSRFTSATSEWDLAAAVSFCKAGGSSKRLVTRMTLCCSCSDRRRLMRWRRSARTPHATAIWDAKPTTATKRVSPQCGGESSKSAGDTQNSCCTEPPKLIAAKPVMWESRIPEHFIRMCRHSSCSPSVTGTGFPFTILVMVASKSVDESMPDSEATMICIATYNTHINKKSPKARPCFDVKPKILYMSIWKHWKVMTATNIDIVELIMRQE
mmetsp:Transcript_53691/g.150896  ORF Transcript_53691/g.150896 Transcript_53691/m.150896 type:complete len:246 (+) Transcript_53691:740-1477(+)